MSPPGKTDCSGSHWRMVPFTATVLMLARALSPPSAWTALLTRLSLRGEAVAPATTTNEARSRTAVLLMDSPNRTRDAGEGTWGPRCCQLAAPRGAATSLGRAGHGATRPRARSERGGADVPYRDRDDGIR